MTYLNLIGENFLKKIIMFIKEKEIMKFFQFSAINAL
jgi:hypothetical protein